jgi:hypothetical protein
LYTEIAKFKFKYMWKYEIYDGKVLLLQRNWQIWIIGLP